MQPSKRNYYLAFVFTVLGVAAVAIICGALAIMIGA
jgi:hypothetical protein